MSVSTQAELYRLANDRRLQLIDKQYSDNSLTQQEADELESLQKWIDAYLTVHGVVNKEKMLVVKALDKLRTLLVGS